MGLFDSFKQPAIGKGGSTPTPQAKAATTAAEANSSGDRRDGFISTPKQLQIEQRVFFAGMDAAGFERLARELARLCRIGNAS